MTLWSAYYMNRSFVTLFFKYFKHLVSFTNVSWANNNMGSFFICWNNMIVDIVFVIINVFNFWLLFLDWVFIAVFSSISIVKTFAISFIFQVVIFVYFYVTSITNSIQLVCKFYLQNRTEQNRTEQNRTD